MNSILTLTDKTYNESKSLDYDYFVLALKGYSENFLVKYELNELIEIISKNKNIIVSINKSFRELEINKFLNVLDLIIKEDPSYFIISDFGLLNIFKKKNLLHKVIFNPKHYITNSYTINELIKIGVNCIFLSNELKSEDVEFILSTQKENIAIQIEGYPLISSSKRKILTQFIQRENLKTNSNIFYLKEHNREEKLPVFEDESGMYLYNNKLLDNKKIMELIKKDKPKFVVVDCFNIDIDNLRDISSNIRGLNE